MKRRVNGGAEHCSSSSRSDAAGEAPRRSEALVRMPERSGWVVIKVISSLAPGESFPC